MFELDFNVKFSLLHLLKFLSDLKSTIFVVVEQNRLSYFNIHINYITKTSFLSKLYILEFLCVQTLEWTFLKEVN